VISKGRSCSIVKFSHIIYSLKKNKKQWSNFGSNSLKKSRVSPFY